MLWHGVQRDNQFTRQTHTDRQTGQVHGQHSVVWHQKKRSSPVLLWKVQWIITDTGYLRFRVSRGARRTLIPVPSSFLSQKQEPKWRTMMMMMFWINKRRKAASCRIHYRWLHQKACHICPALSYLDRGRPLCELVQLFLSFLPVVQEKQRRGQEEHAPQDNDEGTEHEGISKTQELPQG